jgi:hypothetical protein
VANFDPEGVLFAVAINLNLIKLNDIKSFSKVKIEINSFLNLFVVIFG